MINNPNLIRTYEFPQKFCRDLKTLSIEKKDVKYTLKLGSKKREYECDNNRWIGTKPIAIVGGREVSSLNETAIDIITALIEDFKNVKSELSLTDQISEDSLDQKDPKEDNSINLWMRESLEIKKMKAENQKNRAGNRKKKRRMRMDNP